MRSASPWKPSAIAGASSRLCGSKSRVRVTLQADSSSAWNRQCPSRRLNGPARSAIAMWCGGESVFSVVNHVRSAPKRSEEHTSELQSLMRISYAVFCLKKKKRKNYKDKNQEMT